MYSLKVYGNYILRDLDTIYDYFERDDIYEDATLNDGTIVQVCTKRQTVDKKKQMSKDDWINCGKYDGFMLANWDIRRTMLKVRGIKYTLIVDKFFYTWNDIYTEAFKTLGVDEMSVLIGDSFSGYPGLDFTRLPFLEWCGVCNYKAIYRIVPLREIFNYTDEYLKNNMSFLWHQVKKYRSYIKANNLAINRIHRGLPKKWDIREEVNKQNFNKRYDIRNRTSKHSRA